MTAARLARRSVALAAACAMFGALAGGVPARAQERAPFKIGLLIPVTGVFAAPGSYMREGLELYLSQHENELGGRKVELDVGDSQGNPSVGLTQARKLVEQDHVDVLFGPLSAAVGAALIPYIDQHKVPTVYPIVSSDDLTQRTLSPYVARTEWTSSQTTHVLGDYAYKKLHVRKVATIAYDFSFGWESIGGFVDVFQSEGGKVVKQIWTPLVTPDYSPYLSALPRDVDAVVCSFSGVAAVNFIKQYRQFGLKMPLLCQGNTTDESTLAETGPAAVGVVGALQYSAALDTPANHAFVAAYTKAYGHEPSYYAEGTYSGAQLLDHALAAVRGNSSDAEAFARALKHATLGTVPRGPVTFDAYGNPIENVYVRRAESRDGKLQNTVVETYPHVSQFWTWSPKEYLAKPVYDRTHPACNACG
ncbi:MAG TPA: ABC transporter substrate-binding protein [Candidatus Baltobacteraceae bacterium]|nr:ABC transporter substrate-binding protein [Candidatus Baltobacteraceae bacterium]